MEQVLVWDCEWQNIPLQDWPPPGAVYVCKDCLGRLRPHDTWIVSVMGNGTLEGDTVQLGIFWQKENAVLFAECFASKSVEA